MSEQSAARVRVAVLAVHPSSVAATRLRAVQFADAFAERGITLSFWSLFTTSDLVHWYGSSTLRRALVLLRALWRLRLVRGVVRGTAVVVVQREALPLGPPLVELLAAKGRRLVWDVDDAVWTSFTSPTAGRVPRWLRATGGKYERMCARADEVWAGSEVLAQWCRQHSAAVRVVPTVVPVPEQRPSAGHRRTVGWVGSHSTGPFLEAVLPAVSRVHPPPEAIVVGADVDAPTRLRTAMRGWSQTAEDEALASMRVGLYPVDRSHPLADGKCGLKGILYMSHGIPCVITPTPTNAAVVRDGVDGLHADSPEEWTDAVQRLLDDDELWERMSISAHERAREKYSVQVWGPRLAQQLCDLSRRT